MNETKEPKNLRTEPKNGRTRSLVFQFFRSFVLSFFSSSVFLISTPTALAGAADRIVAVVNEEIVTESDVLSQMSALLRDEDPPADSAQARQMQQAVLQRLIDERLILQEAKRLGLTVGSDEVAERLRDIRARFERDEEYAAMLKESGLTEEQLKLKLRQQLLVQKAIDAKIRSRVLVSPAELTGPDAQASGQAGEEVLAQHLLIRVTKERPAEQALAMATQLQERLRSGESFEELARTYSEDPHAQDGGRLGWVRHGELLPELDEALFALRDGECSAPIKSPLGFHLVKLLERRSLSEEQAAASRREAEQRLYQDKFAKAMTQWLQELRRRAYIELMDE
ncbi:MAG: peptidylprolyl isomerase [Candidatus Omnitrophica bacterium]|nr:peptidylprolyl isomerase [Candidatus Omnitrophota bacterium]